MQKKPRLLFSNFGLYQKAGSELYTYEMVSWFLEQGYEVGVFTFLPGAISHAMKSLGCLIFTPHNQADIEAYQPDIVHVHHLPCLYYLASLKLNAPFIHSLLGPENPFEAPAPQDLGISYFWLYEELSGVGTI